MSDLQAAVAETFGDDFEVLRTLGEGSKSVVFLARESALRRLVAIKVLKPDQAADVTTRKRFGREGRSMASIRQRNVVDIHRVGELENGVPFMVMEYVQGRTLQDTLEARGPYEIGRAMDILVEVASALEAAHKEGVIHRDLRPENVLDEHESGRMVLTDFGLAGVAPTRDPVETRLTVQGQLLGDPRYSSPEQLQGEDVTESTDLYSLGILGYEILTKQHPYDARSHVEMLSAHLQKEPRSLAELLPAIDPALADLLMRCLRKKPEQRPTAREVRETINALRAGASEASHPPPPTNPVLAFMAEVRRRRVGQVAVAYIAAGFVAVQAADAIFGTLDDLAWLQEWIVIGVLVGFGPAVILAWIYDITSKGIRRTDIETESGISRRAMLALQVTAMSVLAVAAVLIGLALLGP